MHRLIHCGGVRHFVYFEAPSLAVSLALAELFYKFGSFLLEALAFLATWYLVSFFFDRVSGSHKAEISPPASTTIKEETQDGD